MFMMTKLIITHETIELTVTGQGPVCNFRYEIHPNNWNKPCLVCSTHIHSLFLFGVKFWKNQLDRDLNPGPWGF